MPTKKSKKTIAKWAEEYEPLSGSLCKTCGNEQAAEATRTVLKMIASGASKASIRQLHLKVCELFSLKVGFSGFLSHLHHHETALYTKVKKNHRDG